MSQQIGSSAANLKAQQQQQQIPRTDLKPTKPQNIEIFSCFISYCGSSDRTHECLQNLKEHLATRYPNIDIIADKLPGSEEVFDVRIKRSNGQDVFGDRIPVDKLKNQASEVIKAMEDRIDKELANLKIDFGKPLAECLPADIKLSTGVKNSPSKGEGSGKKEPADRDILPANRSNFSPKSQKPVEKSHPLSKFPDSGKQA